MLAEELGPLPWGFAGLADLAKMAHFLTLKGHTKTPGLVTSADQKGRADTSGFQEPRLTPLPNKSWFGSHESSCSSTGGLSSGL